MGIDHDDLKFILTARKFGCELGEICTLGRMSLFATPAQIESLLGEAGLFSPALWDRFDRTDPSPYADAILEFIGGGRVSTIDFSDYERASITLDLNRPIPEELHGRFDLVFDGGTMEHVFHYPTALTNAMKLLKVGGHLFLKTPSNNLCGHGFYQFSPELFFRAMTPENGFELLRIYMCGEGRHYHVVDPQLVHGRVMLLSPGSSLLMVHARKVSDVEPFSRPPQQSDYVDLWDDSKATEPEARDGRLKAMLRRRLNPDQVRRVSQILNRYRQRREVRRWRKESRLSNRRFYRPVTDWEVTTGSVTGADSLRRPAATAAPRLEGADQGAPR